MLNVTQMGFSVVSFLCVVVAPPAEHPWEMENASSSEISSTSLHYYCVWIKTLRRLMFFLLFLLFFRRIFLSRRADMPEDDNTGESLNFVQHCSALHANWIEERSRAIEWARCGGRLFSESCRHLPAYHRWNIDSFFLWNNYLRCLYAMMRESEKWE